MELESSYNLLGIVRDDGIRTYRAIEIGSGEEMQVHLFAKPDAAADRALFRALRALPASKRRELLEIGIEEDTPYIVTEKLPDSSTAREWLTKLAGIVEKPSGPVFLAGSWKTGTPIPEELVRASHAPPVPPPAPTKPAELSADYTRVMRVPDSLSAAPPAVKPQDPAPLPQASAPPPPPEIVPAAAVPPPIDEPDAFTQLFGNTPPPKPATPPQEPGEFTRMFLASQAPPAAPPVVPSVPAATAPTSDQPGEFTRQFLATQPLVQAQPVLATPVLPPQPAVEPQPPTGTVSAMFPPAKRPANAPGEFTSMFLAAQPPQPPPVTPLPAAPPPPDSLDDAPTRLFQAVTPATPPLASQPPAGKLKDGPSEFTRFFQSPMYPTPAGNQKPLSSPSMPTPVTNRPSATASEFTQMFGNPNKPSSTPPPPLGSGNAGSSGSATGLFAVGKSAPPLGQAKAPAPSASGPGEFTRMMSASTPPTLGQPVAKPPVTEAPPAKSNMLLYVAGGCVLLAIILIVVFFLMKS